MFQDYPKFKYHPMKDPELVASKEEERELGVGWYDSPADFGVETCPGKRPDPAIAKKRSSLESKSAGKGA